MHVAGIALTKYFVVDDKESTPFFFESEFLGWNQEEAKMNHVKLCKQVMMVNFLF